MLLESVPNLSLGPGDPGLEAVLDALEGQASPGWALLDVHTDADHARTVLTLAGAPAPLARALGTMVDAATEAADLEGHAGVHPRVGLIDVVPVIALHQARRQDAIRTAHVIADDIAARDVPVYFYGDLVPPPGQARLAKLRARLKGPYHGDDPLDPPPDQGPERMHPRYGASCVGARDLLIAYNVVLDTTDLDHGKAIATAIRERDGGLPGVQSLAFPLASQQDRVQVSCNLTKVDQATPADVFDQIATLAKARGVEILTGELVGLAPDRSLPEDPGDMGLANPPESLEDRLAAAGLPTGTQGR